MSVRLSIKPESKVSIFENDKLAYEHEKVSSITISEGFLAGRMRIYYSNGCYAEYGLETSDLYHLAVQIGEKRYTLSELYVQACKNETVLIEKEEKKRKKDEEYRKIATAAHQFQYEWSCKPGYEEELYYDTLARYYKKESQ